MRFISYNYHVCKGVRKNLMKLEVKELRKSFGDKEVLHGISFSIESGKALGLLGRNGAGKTTTTRILMDGQIPEASQWMADRFIREISGSAICRRREVCIPRRGFRSS